MCFGYCCCECACCPVYHVCVHCGSRRIQELTWSGEYVSEITADVLRAPYGIAVDGEHIVVSQDGSTDKILVFSQASRCVVICVYHSESQCHLSFLIRRFTKYALIKKSQSQLLRAFAFSYYLVTIPCEQGVAVHLRPSRRWCWDA